MAVLLTGAAVAGTLALRNTTSQTARLTQRLSPASLAAQRLETALVDQETGLRGYVITADPQFLQPYQAGLDAERQAAADLRARLRDEPALLADVAVVERQAAAWRADLADPLIAAVRAGGKGAVDPAAVDRGRQEFDRIRGTLAAQTQRLDAARAQAARDLGGAQAARNGIFIGILALIVLAGGAMALLLRYAVLLPLSRLGAGVRRVADGDFTHELQGGGSADLDVLAADVNAMRQRLVDELAFSTTARATLEEQADELRRSNAELEQFAYVASHDLQEPLRKVASFCQLLERRYGDKLDERGRQYIDFAVDGARRMQILINDLLTFSRVGRLHDRQESVDLDAALDQALANLGSRIEDNGAEIKRLPLPTVDGDPTLLTMLLQNLVGNALKFRRPDVPPVVQVSGEETADGWEIAVADNGIGIDPQFGDKIFVIFQRLHSRDSYGGTGIGLAIAKKIVEYHGGRIRLDDSYTDGARICFTLPREVTETNGAVT